MPTIPLVSELSDVLKGLPEAIKQVPAEQKSAREEIIQSLYDLSDAVSQALNVVSVRCGQIISARDDFPRFRTGLIELPQLLNEFHIAGVCAGLGRVRIELRTVLNIKGLSIKLFYRKRLETLLEYIQYKERDLEEDFQTFFRDLSSRASMMERHEIPELVQYLRDCQGSFEDDARMIRAALREVENKM